MHVSRPYRVGIIAALALLCMAPKSGGRPHVREKPENAGNRRRYRCGRPPGCRTDRLAGCRRPSRRQATGSGVRRRSGRRLRVEIRDRRISGRQDAKGRPSPSIHSAVAFAGASYIQRRYGWKFGAPAYALAVDVGWSRIGARRAKTRHLGRARRSGFGSGLRLPVYEALTANGGRRSPSFRSARSANASESAPPSCSESSRSANGQIGHVIAGGDKRQRPSIESFQKRISRPGERLRTAVHETGPGTSVTRRHASEFRFAAALAR